MRAWRHVDRIAAAEDDRRRHESRHLEVWVDDDGMLVVRGRLSPEVGAVVQRALEAASDRLYHDADDKTEVSVGQRRADALGLIAESALAADLDRGTADDRYQVVVHVEADGLGNDAAAGHSVLEDGIGVPAETSRRLACDASRVVMTHARDGTVLDVGRKTLTIPPAIRRALASRNRRCRFPGCDASHCDAHHVRHWAKDPGQNKVTSLTADASRLTALFVAYRLPVCALLAPGTGRARHEYAAQIWQPYSDQSPDGGATRLDNLLLVCRHHHRAVHEGGFTVELRDDGEARFFWPDGRPFLEAPPAPRWAGPTLGPTSAHLATAGLAIDRDTATPDWLGERLDVNWALTVLHSATAAPPRSDLSAGTRSTPDGNDMGAVN